MRTIAAITMAVLATPALAQPPAPKPGPEHDALKAREGTWNVTMKAGGAEFKGTLTAKMELGGLWLVSATSIDMGGQPFTGRSLDSYDAGKKKFVSVWADSMGTTPMLMEGTMDAAGKTLTMSGDGPGMDGKPATWKSVATMPDADTMDFAMYVGPAKEPMFTIVYKRAK